MIATKPVLAVKDLTVDYATEAGAVRAVDRVTLEVAPGEFIGIVGESGCGKSTLLYGIARLLSPPASVVGGSVHLLERDLLAMDEEELREIRWRNYSLVMQSAMNALNPVLTVGDQLADTMAAHEPTSGRMVRQRSTALLRMVGIDPVHLKSYPHQLSGGMRQRAMIAMSLVFTPELVIMDEPTSALDVVAQRSLMLQIKELQRKIGFAALFVTHDMSLVSHFSDRLAVMYAGQIVELGKTREVFDDPKHPYTRALMQSFPSVVGAKQVLQGIPGTPPDLAHPPKGCRFAPRCPLVEPRFRTEEPPMVTIGNNLVRCHLYGREH
ncbi:MAG TPA: ABC transporter ATP-binding protein [Candidatus Angelobacter sp.]|nr:ABC transporter ATP-binding protein [Candidatus Angelobacter sp.]